MAETNPQNGVSRQARNFMIFSTLRAALGILWFLLAISTWSADFARHVYQYNQEVFPGSHGWLTSWFGTWVSIITPVPGLFLYGARILTILIAICLLLGLARKTVYIVGIIITLPLWTLMEGYTPDQAFGTINLGLAVSYILFFLSFLLINRINGTTPHSLDFYVGKRLPWWRHISEWSNINLPSEQPMLIPWRDRIPIVFAVVGILSLLIGTSVISGHVGPIQIGAGDRSSERLISTASTEPIANPYAAVVPPLLGDGNDVNVELVATEHKVEIASGIDFNGWTFNDTIPAPTLHVRQGQTLHVKFTNKHDMLHSIDFHSAMIAPSKAYIDVEPGDSVEFSFKAEVPGIFIYHCGTAPVLEHMAMGMYGAIIVDPIDPLPEADVSYVLVQSEFYAKSAPGNTYEGDISKMRQRKPDFVVFNGIANQYIDHPLEVPINKRVRIYFVNDGVIEWSAFHVIGGIFDKVYPSGGPEGDMMSDALTGVSTDSVAPGEGKVYDIFFPEAGNYTFVDHNMANMELGAAGLFTAK